MTQNPSIGIEIELPWPVMLRRVDEEAATLLEASRGFFGMTEVEQARVQIGFDLLDEQYKSLVQSVFGHDIQKGNDGFTEFALYPRRDCAEIVETTQRLYELGILLPHEEYPLHVTIGDVPLTPSSWLILSCMEVAGGTTPQRITQSGTWDRKGQAGILERKPQELRLGSKQGFEMRSLSLTAVHELSRSLSIAQTMGSLLVQKLEGDNLAITTWKEAYKHLISAFSEKGIDASYKWPNPSLDVTSWQQLAEALRDESWQRSVQTGLAEIV